MTKIAIELDDTAMAAVEELARARHMSVEALARDAVSAFARQVSFAPHAPQHCKFVEIAAVPRSETFSREEVNDRDLARADVYLENRRRLLALVDTSEGDMGTQRWNRRQIYDR